MTQTVTADSVVQGTDRRMPRRRGMLWIALRQSPTGAIGAAILLVFALLAVLAPILWGEAVEAVNMRNTYLPASWAHPFGTDAVGRDVFFRTLVATRLSLLSGVAAAAISVVIGTSLGLLTVAVSGRARMFLARVIDTLIALPTLLVAIVVSTILGVGIHGVILGIGLSLSFSFARLTSSLALSIGGREYVKAAQVLGLSSRRVSLRHILPNIAEPLLIGMFSKFTSAVLAIAGMSFLGLGTQYPQFDWGQLMSTGIKAIYIQPAGGLGPAMAIGLCSLALSMVGEALSKASNPLLWQGGSDATPVPASTQTTNHATPVAVAGQLSADNTDSLVRVRGLTVTVPGPHGPIDVVQSVDFDIGTGEAVGLVGESGSGKSMTALALARLTRHPGKVSGSIEIAGQDVVAMPKAALRRYLSDKVAVVFQDPSSSLNPALKIGQQMTLGIRRHRKINRKVALAEAVDKLAEVNVSRPAWQIERHPHELSGGMRQRVMIAAGLLTQPKLLIADEPTTALDVTVQAQIMDLLEQINRTHGTSVLMISHNLAMITQNCTRVMIMYAGRIVEDLETSRFVDGPRHPYSRALVRAMPGQNDVPGKPFSTIPGELPDPGSVRNGCAFAARCELAEPRCRIEQPPLLRRPDGGRVACHVANEDLLLQAGE